MIFCRETPGTVSTSSRKVRSLLREPWIWQPEKELSSSECLEKGEPLVAGQRSWANPQLLVLRHLPKTDKALFFSGNEVRALMLSSAALGFCVLERLCFFLRDRIQSVYGAMERL